MKLTRLGMRSTYSEHVGTTKAQYWMRSSFTWACTAIVRSTYSEHVGTTRARYWMRSYFTWTGQKLYVLRSLPDQYLPSFPPQVVENCSLYVLRTIAAHAQVKELRIQYRAFVVPTCSLYVLHMPNRVNFTTSNLQ